jgi:ADP-dependent NAD(P)H-hydrate dehydratase / NAD(P)H-hydrate epimerase
MLVKGERDYVADKKGIIETISEPREPSMEAIGGTGDTITGIVSALVAAGYDIPRAAGLAARTNRLAGRYARPTPATKVMDIIQEIPRALREALGPDGLKESHADTSS